MSSATLIPHVEVRRAGERSVCLQADFLAVGDDEGSG